MPPQSINTLHCLILESKVALKQIPPHLIHYFINSKRRFFLYFRLHQQMLEAMHILHSRNIKFYPRESLLPDREEYEEHVYHCNYRFKKQDLRKNLYHSTPYNQPKLLFEKYEGGRRISREADDSMEPEKDEGSKEGEKMIDQKDDPKNERGEEQQKNRLKDEKLRQIFQDKELIAGIFKALNFMK